MFIQDSDDIQINNPFIMNDLTLGSDCIRVEGTSVKAQVSGGRLVGSTRGVHVKDTATALVQNVQAQDQDDYGINAADTSVVTSRGNTISGASLLANENKDSGATLDTDQTVLTVASAATITVTSLVASISGTTNITSVVATGYAGRTITLIFQGALTFTDGSNLKLAGNLVTTADDTITLVCDGTNWYEIGRAVN
jgi:hypothetical protein